MTGWARIVASQMDNTHATSYSKHVPALRAVSRRSAGLVQKKRWARKSGPQTDF